MLTTFILIQIYFRMHRFVVKFSNFFSPQAARGIDLLTKILRTFLARGITFVQKWWKITVQNIMVIGVRFKVIRSVVTAKSGRVVFCGDCN